MRTETKGLLADEVCRIIKEAARVGVSELSFGNLHVRFGTPPGKVQQTPAATVAPAPDMPEAQQKKISDDAFLGEELRVRADQLESALLENPEEYERLLRSGELDDGLDAANRDDFDDGE